MASVIELASERIFDVSIPAGSVTLRGELRLPANASGVVLFAHGSGNSRHDLRNQFVAQVFREAGAGTLLFDLLTPEEESVDCCTDEVPFDIVLLGRRLVAATNWLAIESQTKQLAVGYFGSNAGTAAALVAAAQLGGHIRAVVSRGGRPELAGKALPFVIAPTLLIVGGRDYPVIKTNEAALAQLRCEKRLEIVPGAMHLFAEPGTLEQVAHLASVWFANHLAKE